MIKWMLVELDADTAARPEAMKRFEVRSADLTQPAGRRPVLLMTRTPACDYPSRIVVAEITTHRRGIPQGCLQGGARGCRAPASRISMR